MKAARGRSNINNPLQGRKLARPGGCRYHFAAVQRQRPRQRESRRQQNAITQAGGVGAMAAKNNQATAGGQSVPVAAPVPPAGSLPVPPIPAVGGGDPLLKTVQNIVQADAECHGG
jgi:hypothetical protein